MKPLGSSLLYCVKLVCCVHGSRRDVVKGARRIRREKLKEHSYIEGYGRCL